MVAKIANDIMQIVNDPNARVSWNQLSPQQQTMMRGWHKNQQAKGLPFTARYSAFMTGDGPKYFDWQDYPGT